MCRRPWTATTTRASIRIKPRRSYRLRRRCAPGLVYFRGDRVRKTFRRGIRQGRSPSLNRSKCIISPHQPRALRARKRPYANFLLRTPAKPNSMPLKSTIVLGSGTAETSNVIAWFVNGVGHVPIIYSYWPAAKDCPVLGYSPPSHVYGWNTPSTVSIANPERVRAMDRASGSRGGRETQTGAGHWA